MFGLSDFAATLLVLSIFGGIVLATLITWLAEELHRVTRELHAKNIKSLHNGIQTARELFALAKIRHVHVQITNCKLSDYYDTQERTIYLSEETASEPTLVATGIVAHEVGHALQDEENFWLMRQSENILRLNKLTGNFTLPIFTAGIFLDLIELVLTSCLLFIVSAICNVLLFCLHRDASKRGEIWLRCDKFVSKEEERMIERFLGIANLTYLGGIATTPLQIYFTLAHAVQGLSHRK